jgi:flagellar motor switch protein FliM
MTEQILSQEEIDSLLGAMDSGKIDLNLAAKNKPEIESYDITSHSVKLPEHFQILGEICDRFATFLRTSLSSTLQRKINVKFVSSDIVNFEVFMEKFSNPTDFTKANQPYYSSPIIFPTQTHTPSYIMMSQNILW